MKIAVLGSGGIGGYYGVALLRGGHDVVFIARGSHLEAMRRSGLTIRTASGESVVPVSAVADTRDAGPVDLVLFCVKAYDTGEAADALPPLLGPDTSVLTLQNGVDSAALVSAVAGAGRVLAGAVYVALQIMAPGVIRHTGGDGRIVFGVPGGAATAQAERVAEAFQRAGSPPRAVAGHRRGAVGEVPVHHRRRRRDRHGAIGDRAIDEERRGVLRWSPPRAARWPRSDAARGTCAGPTPSRRSSLRPGRCRRSGAHRWRATSSTAAGSRSRR